MSDQHGRMQELAKKHLHTSSTNLCRPGKHPDGVVLFSSSGGRRVVLQNSPTSKEESHTWLCSDPAGQMETPTRWLGTTKIQRGLLPAVWPPEETASAICLMFKVPFVRTDALASGTRQGPCQPVTVSCFVSAVCVFDPVLPSSCRCMTSRVRKPHAR